MNLLKQWKFLYAFVLMFFLYLLNFFFELSIIKTKFILGFSIFSLMMLSFIIILTYRNYLLLKKFDYFFFAMSYTFLALIFFCAILLDFNYKSFRYYYFNFIKIFEVLILFFGIFIMRERINIKNLKKPFIISIAAITIYLLTLLRFNLFFLNMLLLYGCLWLVYRNIETKGVKNYFIEIILLKSIAESFDILSENFGYTFLYPGSYIFYEYSLIKLMLYFNSTLNRGYLGNFYLKEKKVRNIINTSNDGIIVLNGYFVKKINKQAMKILDIKDINRVKNKNIFSVFENLKKEDVDDIVNIFPNELTLSLSRYGEGTKKLKMLGYQYKWDENDEIVLIIRNPNSDTGLFYKTNDELDMVVFLYDLESKKYKYVNKAVIDIIGYTPEDFYNEYSFFQKIVYRQDMEKYLTFFNSDSKNREEELRFIKHDGSLIWLHQKLFSVVIDEKEYLYGIGIDITEKKKTEIEITSKNTNLEEINQRRDMSLSVVSHEIRSPITAIIGFVENILMNKTGIDTKNISMLEKVYSNGMRLKELVNNILDLSKINVGKYETYKEMIEIKTMIDEILLNNEILLTIKGIRAENRVKDNVYINVDENMFYQIITNLFSNAVKYNSTSGTIIIDSNTLVDCTIIKIIDTGTGIKESDKENIFKEYERGSGVKEKGTGIGLSLVKQMVELNDGEIWFESEINIGTTFYLRFPHKKKDTMLD